MRGGGISGAMEYSNGAEDEFDMFTLSQQAHERVDPVATQDAELGGKPGHTRSKLFNDSIWGHIRIPGICIDVIDTPAFQRLRDLHQLGTSYYVFPGACHRRFEHSIGVCYKAWEMSTHIYRNQHRELSMDASDIKVVTLAGLCHDLGHGPFSHVFDNEFLPKVLGRERAAEWNHEDMSAKMFEHLVDEHNIDRITPDEMRRVKEIVTSSLGSGGTTNDEKGFLTEIVANGRNSIDVDKFDYIARDCHHCGVSSSFDSQRILPFTRVLDNQICFKASEATNIYELFNTRASLHRKVYTHPKAKAIEYMIVDALVAADPVMHLSDRIGKVEDYMSLDDTILKHIEYSKHMGLKESRDIVNRFRRRDLYRYCNEFLVPVERLPEWKDVSAQDVINCQPAGSNLRAEDIVVQNLKINYSMGSKNPVDYVKFYQDYDSTSTFRIPKEKVSAMIPAVFLERKVRVFSKKSDEQSVKNVSEAFEKFQRRDGYTCSEGEPMQVIPEKGVSNTPQKTPRGKRPRLDIP